MDIKHAIVAILDTENEIVGTGFLADECLIVTCAHVVEQAKSGPGKLVRVRFAIDNTERFADVDASADSPKDELDVAILRVSQTPKGVRRLRISSSAGCPGHEFFATGYPMMGKFESLSARGEIINLETDRYKHPYLQLRSQEVVPGMSGGPVMDVARNAVVGMVNSGFMLRSDKKYRDTAFATPTETIWQVCPQLKPPTPILPRRNLIVEGINLLPYDYDQRIQNFLTEYLGTDAHPVPFGGRDDALKMLDTWLAETTPYLLLAAPAGRGKSALLVRWLDSLKARDDLALAFVPVSIRFGINMERVFYAALAARLAFLHGDDIPASPETSTAVYRGLVADYLSKPLANGRTLLVVLDGLDEAADWQAGADFMPGELPAGVRVVVSARFLAGDADSTPWLRRLNWERNGLASAPSLTPLNHDGVRDVLFKMGCPLDELSRQVNIVTELYRLSEGDPLLVGLYVGDLWAKGEAVTRLQPEDLAGIQPGYKGYFDRWWDDQKKLWGKDKPWLEKHVRAVRNLLAGALGPLLRDDFQALEPELESDYIADAMDVLQRFVIGDNQTQGYTFSHPKLGQYFWEALTVAEQAQVEARFLTWGEQTLQEFIEGKRDPRKKAEVPAYVVRNYGAHLARANHPIEKWLPLIHHQQWAQAWFTLEGAYGGYSQDVQRVWGKCKIFDRQVVKTNGKAPYLGQQIRCALIESSLSSVAGNIPSGLIALLFKHNIWTFPQSMAVIRQTTDEKQKADDIVALLPYLTDATQFQDVLNLLMDFQNDESCSVILKILVERLVPELLDDALRIARRLSNSKYKALVFVEIAKKKTDLLPEALQIITKIRDDFERAYVLVTLSETQPDIVTEAFQTIKNIQDDKGRISALLLIIRMLPAGSIYEVLHIMRGIWDEQGRANILIAMAKKLPSDLLSEATNITLEIKNDKLRADVFCALARYYVEVVPQALTAARDVLDEDDRASALCALAEDHPGLLREAVKATRKIWNENKRAYNLLNLSKIYPDLLPEAAQIARNLYDVENRAFVLRLLAIQAPKLFPEAFQAANKIRNIQNRAYSLCILAQQNSKYTREACKAAREISDKGSRIKALCLLGNEYPGALYDALKAIKEIQDDISHAKILCALAWENPKPFSSALKAARKITNKPSRVSALYALAKKYPRLFPEVLKGAVELQANDLVIQIIERFPDKFLDVALDEASNIIDEGNRVIVLSLIAGKLPSKLLPKALNITRKIQNDAERANALFAFLKLCPELFPELLATVRKISTRDEQSKGLIPLLEGHPELVNETLQLVNEIQDDEKRAELLCSLANKIPVTFLPEALQIAKGIRNVGSRAFALSSLAENYPELFPEALRYAREVYLDWKRAYILRSLARNQPDVIPEALIAAKEIPNENSRIHAVIMLAKQHPELYSDVLKSISEIQDDSCYVDALKCVSEIFPSENIIDELLQVTRKVEDDWNHARMLSIYAKHKPEMFRLMFQVVPKIQDSWKQAEILISISKELPLEFLKDALNITRQMQDESECATLLESIADRIRHLPTQKRYLLLEETLPFIATTRRSNVFSHIAELIGSISATGNIDTPREIYSAVRDVTTWWP